MLGGSQAQPPILIVGEFPDFAVGVPYDEELSIVGGTSPYVVDALSGYVPPGLVLEASVDGLKARLHGTPVELEIIGTLPDAAIGTPYSERLSVTGYAGTVTPDIVAGAMPAWMSMAWDAGTGEIEFYGTPV